MNIDPKLLDQCVGCGLCLTSCPTFAVTHLEQHGPRGRIQGMRLVENGSFDILDPDHVESMETCVQCRACEEVCPSDVEFGALMEQARSDIVEAKTARAPDRRPRVLIGRALLALVAHPRLLRVATVLLSLAQRVRLDRLLPGALRVAKQVQGSHLPADARSDASVHLFRGCVMDRWFGEVHDATHRVLAATGERVGTAQRGSCCGALHLHAGQTAAAKELARETIAAFEGTTGPIVVNSAGCGAAMKEYGRLLDTPEAHGFAERVQDLAEAVDPQRLPLQQVPAQRLAWQAPCHLRNVQGTDTAARDLLAAVPGVTLVEADDGQMCCGAGGAYSVLQPTFSTAMRDQKCDALRQTGCDGVVTANPGCSMQLASGGLEVRHVAEVIADALPTEPT